MAKKRKRLRESVTAALGLSSDLLSDGPRIALSGDAELMIENHKGVLEYEETLLRLNCADFIVSISGQNLSLAGVTESEALVRGKIQKIELS
jgi:sporulation protein YqfC